MKVPDRVRLFRLFRLVHIDNLPVLLKRGTLHAPHTVPDDGLPYKTIHDVSIQERRHLKAIPCGAGGVVHDYLPFYLGPLSPMLYKLSKGGVTGYSEGQESLIYLVYWASDVARVGLDFVFSDGHGIAAFTQWFDDLADLDQLDWPLIMAREWSDTLEDNDRKRRKQAEFLVYQSISWSLIKGIAVMNSATGAQVNTIMDQYPSRHRPKVAVVSKWFY